MGPTKQATAQKLLLTSMGSWVVLSMVFTSIEFEELSGNVQSEGSTLATDGWNGDPLLMNVDPVNGIRQGHRLCFRNGTCVCDDGFIGG